MSEGFVSVAEAAAILGVSDRTARRMAGQLADDDRTPDTGQGRHVRLSAMRSLREKAPQVVTDGRTQGTGYTPDMTARTKTNGRVRPDKMSGHVSGSEVEGLREIVKRQDGEIGYLRSALDKSQSLQLAALGEAAAMRARVEALETQNRALIESKPEGAEKASDRTEGDSTKPDTGAPRTMPDGSTVAPEGQSAQNQAVEGESGFPAWWRRVFGGGSR